MSKLAQRNFDILCVDSTNGSKIHTREQLLHSLLSNGDLWNSPRHDQIRGQIDADDICVDVKGIDTNRASEFVPQKAFLLNVEGEFDALERFRLPLVAHVRSQGFELVYILRDEISETIASEIYPLINRVENRLRGYLIKFFVTKLGPNWWKQTADSEMRKKAHERQNNETVFRHYIDNNVYLIDFGEIGKIVYAQSSGFLNKEHIIERVMSLEKTAEAVEKLQRDLNPNYSKFFKETFKDKGFEGTWIQLEKIRHRVAHSNLFIADDLTTARELTKSLEAVIDTAEERIDSLVFTKGEQVVVEEAIIESLKEPLSNSYAYPYTSITEEELLTVLDQQETLSKSGGRYVGLSYFVRVHLGERNYDYSTSYSVIGDLARKGLVEIYDATPTLSYKTFAIRRGDGNKGMNIIDGLTQMWREPRW